MNTASVRAGITIAIACALITAIAHGSAHAESVFLKNGRILEGKIAAESDRSIDLLLPGGTRTTIPRAEVLRTLYHDNYKQKRYIYKTDGTTIEAHIVDENSESYTCRTDLNSPVETWIRKSDVETLSKRKIDVSDAGGRPYHSPVVATIASLAPVWSGSWNAGFTWWGLGFCAFKTAGAAGVVYSFIGPTGMGERIGFASLGAWVGFTIIDMIYSYNRIDNHNTRHGLASRILDDSAVGVDLLPRYAADWPLERAHARPDGVSVGFSRRF